MGDFNPVVQGATDSGGDQDVFLINSEAAAPQIKAKK
jgi:hypothetical protein